jgi:hypothetical protein
MQIPGIYMYTLVPVPSYTSFLMGQLSHYELSWEDRQSHLPLTFGIITQLSRRRLRLLCASLLRKKMSNIGLLQEKYICQILNYLPIKQLFEHVWCGGSRRLVSRPLLIEAGS